MAARTSKRSDYKSLGLLSPFLGLYMVMLAPLVAAFLAVFWLIQYNGAASMGAKALPPLYHNAQQVRDQLTSTEGEKDIRIVSFVTDDKPDIVKSYYERAMWDAGWGFWGYPFTNAPNTAYFQYVPDDGPTYKVLVKVQAKTTEQTAVSIEMYAIGSSWNGEIPRK